jgi:membrane-bound lytic murein transglycosylase B
MPGEEKMLRSCIARRSRLILSSHLILLAIFLAVPTAAVTESNDNLFESLQERLINDGFDKTWIMETYSRPEVYFETKGISLFLMHRESTLNYDQFASRDSIRKAREYMHTYKGELSRAKKTFGVDSEVITAIILVETRLGTYTGRRSVLNSLSTMAALADPVVRNIFWEQVAPISRLNREDYDKWTQRKSKWAYDELKAFLSYTIRERMKPSDISGSYAGALGISQFMPSNVLSFAKDGDRDGRIDLFSHADAIMSVASYLNHYGWRPGINSEQAYKVIYNYNRSKYYVNTVLKIAEILKG